jgi:Ca-activated chloride channel family protein
MHRRVEHVKKTPGLIVELARYHICLLWGSRKKSRSAIVLFGLMLPVWIWLLVSLRDAYRPQLAMKAFADGDYNRSAGLFEILPGERGRFNAANAWYRSGEFERALRLYGSVRSNDPMFKAAVYYNKGNTLIRLKEFKKAQKAFRNSLALHFDKATLENLMYIIEAQEQDHMLSSRQEGKKRAQDQEAENSQQDRKKRKEGGGSNQQSQAERSRGAGAQGRRAEREMRLEFSDKGASRLSSKQYELINQRSVHETKPW